MITCIYIVFHTLIMSSTHVYSMFYSDLIHVCKSEMDIHFVGQKLLVPVCVCIFSAAVLTWELTQ